MRYSTIADYPKKIAHWAVDATFPDSPTIATISGVASWYGYQVGMAYAPNIINTWVWDQIGSAKGAVVAPLISPPLTPYIATFVSIGTACATSLTLNLLSHGIFKIHSWMQEEPMDKAPASKKKEEASAHAPVVELPIPKLADEIISAVPVVSPTLPIVYFAHELENRINEKPVSRKRPIKPRVKSGCLWNLCPKPAVKTKIRRGHKNGLEDFTKRL